MMCIVVCGRGWGSRVRHNLARTNWNKIASFLRVPFRTLALVSFPDPQAKRREGLGDSLTSMRSGGIHGMQLYYTS